MSTARGTQRRVIALLLLLAALGGLGAGVVDAVLEQVPVPVASPQPARSPS